MRPRRVGVVDVGTNSTRLLIADVGADGALRPVERRAQVTRLGGGVERTGMLAGDAVERTLAVLRSYRAAMDELGVTRTAGVLTSAARDAANGPALLATIRDELGIDARTIPGDEEARLTYLGAVSADGPSERDATTLVVDVGGGSTELVVGRGEQLLSHVSTQVGVVRHSERHLHADPSEPAELLALRADVARTFAPYARADVDRAIAVAGTPTSCAAMLLDLEPYDPDAVEGQPLRRSALEELLTRTAAMTAAQRRRIRGLHPDRSATIVAGIAILLEAMAAFGLEVVLASERDILIGAALQAAGAS
ncbi:MAG TPA: Ppx/GppA family phosphatase [Solirubrobacteraceae bacterium]|nr:Ppx/GppA family phosphatase [Solirubrobacteraceae bacterium]